MRGLTLHQPYAWAVVHADKGVENRPKVPALAVVGHDFAVHAGLTVDVQVWADFRAGRYGELARAVPDIDELVRGAVIGVAHLDNYCRVLPIGPGRDLEADRRWFTGPVGSLLSNRRPLATPIRTRGMQGWWPVPPAVEAEILRQLGASR